jgi:hypothetical protein
MSGEMHTSPTPSPNPVRLFALALALGVGLLLGSLGMIATIYAALGDKDKAFDFMEKAYQARSPDIPYFLRADLRIDSLRSDPRFADLLRRSGLPQ